MKGKKIKIFIVIVCLLVIGLAGYFFYNNSLNSNNNFSFLDKIEGVWGCGDSFLKIIKENNKYKYEYGIFTANDASSGGLIKNITKTKDNQYKLEMFFVNYNSGSSYTGFVTIKLDNKKNVIIIDGREYTFITKDFDDYETIRNFFY